MSGIPNAFAQFDSPDAAPSAPAPSPSIPQIPAIPNAFAQFDNPDNPTPQAAPSVNTTVSVPNAFKQFDASTQSADTLPFKDRVHDGDEPNGQVNEPMYSKVWKWANKPVYDFHNWGTRDGAGSLERGAEEGAEDLLDGLDSPLSIGLMLGTFGGSALEQVGLKGAVDFAGGLLPKGLKILGATEKTAPIYAKGLKVLVDAGFSAPLVYNLAHQSPQFLDALKDGDYETAARLGTNILAGGAMAAIGAKKTFEDAAYIKNARALIEKGQSIETADQIRDTMKTVKKIAGEYEKDDQIAKEHATTYRKTLQEGLKAGSGLDDVTMGGIMKYIEAGGDDGITKLKAQKALLEGTMPVRPESPENPKLFTEEPNPTVKDFGSKKNFEQFVNDHHGGSEDAAKTELAKQFDVAQYTDENGKKVDVELKPQDQIPIKKVWNKGYVYRAVDPVIQPMVVNSGLKTGDFYNSPEEALEKGVLPPSGNREDLKVFAVPRAEAEGSNIAYRTRDVGEQGVPSKSHSQATMSEDEARKYMASRQKVQNGKPQELVRVDLSKLKPGDFVRMAGPNGNDWIKFARDLNESEVEKVGKNKPNLMPSHEVETTNGAPTGAVTPLRPDSEHNLTMDNSRFESQYTQPEKDRLLAAYDKATNLSPEQKQIANELRKFYLDWLDEASKKGMIRTAVENYYPHAFARENPSLLENIFGVKLDGSDNPAFNKLAHQTHNGAFDTSVAAAKHRVFETAFQAEMAGFKHQTFDVTFHAANYLYKMEKAIAGQKFLDSLRASGAKASDGSPLAALRGSSHVVGEDVKRPALLVNPNTPRGIAISQDIVRALQQRGEMEDLVNSGKIDKLPYTREVIDPKTGEKSEVPAYAWNTDKYTTINHPAFRDWQFIGKDTGGNDAILKAQMTVHPEIADYVKQVVGADKSAMRNSTLGRAALAASREVKGGSLLFMSPFHAVQETLRGVMMAMGGIAKEKTRFNPFDWSPANVEGDPIAERLVAGGMKLKDYRAETMTSEGLTGGRYGLGRVPGLGKLNQYIHDLTFNKIVPALKVRAGKSLYYRLLDKMPGASADEIARMAAAHINDVFGGQNWRELGVSASAQDVARTFALAPDWALSEMRMLGRAAGLVGNKASQQIARGDMLKLGAAMFVTTRLLNMLVSGKPHPEAPFGVVVPGKSGEDDKIYSVRTLPTDVMHAVSDPGGFIRGRVNPLIVRPAVEALSGRDEFGRKVDLGQEAMDFVRNVVPIGVQGLLRGGVGSQALGTIDQAAKASGATIYRYRTEAEKLAQEKASDRMPTGPVDPRQLAVHQRNIRLEDALRNGEIGPGTIYHAMPAREAHQIINNSRMTPLQARFDRLPLNDALDVWQIATPSEKDTLHSLLWKKRIAYIRTHTAAQRADDPTWEKMQKIYGDLSQPVASLQPATALQTPITFHQNLQPDESMNDPDTRFNTARHEAAHIVTSEVLRPGSVISTGLNDQGGFTQITPPEGKASVNQLSPEDVRNLVAVSYAGGLGEEGGTTAKHVSADLARRQQILGPQGLAGNEEMAEARARVNAILADPKNKEMMDRVAASLNKKGKLSGDEIRQLLKPKGK